MSKFRKKIKSIIFGTDTIAGKYFDIILICLIILSVIVVLFNSVSGIQSKYKIYLNSAEIFSTIIFTIEYLLRIFCIRRPLSYIFSVFGIIDFLAIIPTYLSFFSFRNWSIYSYKSIKISSIY